MDHINHKRIENSPQAGRDKKDCGEADEDVLRRLRQLWRSLLTRNETTFFIKTKLCRTKMVHFLDGYLNHPSDSARYLALDLLCGSVPRLGDKTDELLKPLVSTILRMMAEDIKKEVAMKALHFLRAYSKATQEIESFMFNFCRMGLESASEETKLNCINGTFIIFDQDIGDKLFSILIPSLANLLNRKGCPKVLRSTYRSLRRINDLIEDDRFFKLMNPETTDLYMRFFNFDEYDPYLNSDLLNFPRLITEYQNKMASIRLKKAFGIVDPCFWTPAGGVGDCQRVYLANNVALSLMQPSCSDSDVESHVLDLIKLLAAFLADDSNQLSQMKGMDILKQLISRMHFHIGQHLTNVVEILRETLASSSGELMTKTKKVVHRLMKVVHPMSVVWEMLREWEPRHKESILEFICGELECFRYCDFDLVSMCTTIGQDMDDCNPKVRQESRKCVVQLLKVMQTCPVQTIREHAIHSLLNNTPLKIETLKSVGISEADCEKFRGESYSYMGDSASLSTAPPSPVSSTSTLVSESSTVHSDVYFKDKRHFGKCKPLNIVQSNRKKFSKFNLKPPDRHAVQSLNDTHDSMLSCCQDNEDSVLSAPSNYDDMSHFKTDPYEELVGKYTLQSSSNSKSNSLSITSIGQRKLISDTLEISPNNISHTTKNLSCYTESIVINCKDSMFDSENHSVYVSNLTETENFEASHPRSILAEKTGDTSRSFLSTNLEQGEPKSMCSVIYNEQVLGKLNLSAIIPDGCTPIGDPKDTSTPRIRTNLSKECNFEPPERKCSLSGGDTLQVTQIKEGCLESWIHRYSREMPAAECSGNEDLCVLDKSDLQEERLADGNCTLVSISSVNTEHAIFDSSVGFQVQSLDPKKYNFNILKVSTPKTTESVQELDGDEIIDYENIAEAFPTFVTTPDESLEFSVSRKSNHFERTQIQGYTQTKHLPQSQNKYSVNPNYYKLEFASPEVGINGVPDENSASAAADQDDEDMEESPSVCTIVDTSICAVDGVQENIGDTINIAKKNEPLDLLTRRPVGKRKSDERPLKRQVVSKLLFSSSVDMPPWCRGRDIPRTPVAILEKNRVENGMKASKKANRKQEDETKNTVVLNKASDKPSFIEKPKVREKKDKRTCVPKDIEDEEEKEKDVEEEDSPTDDIELDDSPYNPLQGGHLCPWKRDLEYAYKGGICPWALSFEESVRQMAPLPSEELAEAELMKALEHLDGNSWKRKEEALEVLLRVAMHHQEVASGEIARIMVAVCREVHNFRKSVAGKAVITLGLLYSTMGKRMDNKLRFVVGSLVTKSGNRTLAAYFRLVIQSLFRIVNSSPPQKVALAFIHEGSRHPNKASRETAAQFLALLTETMGSGNSLSGTMTSPMLKCAAHFVSDCSPLTRYCGKRMFQVLQKHPQFQKMKDHHLDVSTANNLSKMLDHIGNKGVTEEVLPIDVIKEKTKESSPNQENALI